MMTRIKKHISIKLLICFFVLVISCKNYYNDTIAWIDNIEFQTDIEVVKKNQPNFVEIDWGNPEKKDNENWYYILNIRGSNDPLGMSHQLIFIDNKFDRRESHK